MLVTIQHYKSDENHPGRMVFSFEKFSLRHRIRYLDQKIHGNRHASKNIFKYENTAKSAQNKIFKKILKGDNLFALLPDSEKSFCFWMPALSEPGLTIVISPSCILTRDRKTPLSVNFRFHSGSQGIKNEKRKPICAEIELGETGILYIDPESLKIQSFRQELGNIISHEPVHSLVIDNAHCISEWGYDFRPSYLRIPDLVSDLKKTNSKLTLIALTSGAGNIVRQDIMSLLDLKEEIAKPDRNFREFRRFENFRTLKSQFIRPGYKNKADAQEKVTFKIMAPALTDTPRPKVPAVTDKPGTGDIRQARGIEMPGRLCEQDMRERRTGIPRCSATHCEFGRKELCDYGKQHILISENFQDARTDATETLRTLDRIISSSDADNETIQIDTSFTSQKNIETALHRLSVIGVVDDFFVVHKKGVAVFEISGFEKSADTKKALNSLLNYLKKNDMSSNKKYSEYTIEQLVSQKGEIIRCREKYGPDIRKIIKTDAEQGKIISYHSHHALFDKVTDYLLVMLYCIYEEIRRMRYQMLWNLKELINSRACRNAMLLKNFQVTDEKWKCGFCDICVSGPKLAKTSQIPLHNKTNLEKLEKHFMEWLENDDAEFEYDFAEKFTDEFSAYPSNIYIRSGKVLEFSSRNVKALYLAYKFSPENVREKNALDLIRIANQDMELPLVKKLMHETARDNNGIRLSQFDMADDEYGAFNSLEGEKWLYEEAGKLSADPSRTEMLGARVVVNRLMQTDFSGIRSELKKLAE